jgi:Homeobox KN domain
MNLQGMPNKGRPQSPFAEPLPTKTRTFSSSAPSTVSPTPSASSCDPKDDLEIMLLHEDFATLLSAAADLKEIREHIALHRDKPQSQQDDDDEDHHHPHHHRKKSTTTTNASHGSSGDSTDDNGDEASEEASSRSTRSNNNNNNNVGVVVPVFQQIAKSAEHNNQVLTALDRMQKALVVNTNNRNSSGHGHNAGAATTPPSYAKIPAGRYPVIDSVLEDAIAKLQHEYECCEAWIQKQFPTTQAGGISFQSSSSSGKPERTTSLAVKYPKVQTDILMEWMIENREDPFPSEDDLCMLAEKTGLTTSQVVNWTTNVRKRNRKAVLDNKKKPHHFIDFLFLVQERENKKEESRRMYAWQHRKSPEQQQSQQSPLPPPHQQYPSPSSLLPSSDQDGVAGSWSPRHSPLSSHHPHHHDHHEHNSPSMPYHGQPLQHPPHGQIPQQQQQQQSRYQSNHHDDRGSNSLHRRSMAHLFNPLDRSIASVPHHHNAPANRSYPYHYRHGGGGTPPDLAVPDGCISKRIFDEVEDLSASAKQYDDLMGNVKIEDWAPDVEGGGGGASTTAVTDEYHHGPGQHRPYSYHPHHQHDNYGYHHPKQQPQQPPPHHHHPHLPQQVQPPPRHHYHHQIMASASMDSNDNNDDEQRHRVSSLDFEIEHNGKDIDEFVTKNITTHDDML